ncbi:hypothetical protein [Dickeya dianthicola]|uniref:hypothetical protein n=1 Tax=Dickeya dianthicola TaxID=204039 RepID=UPI001865C35E|nr:hypothetical protein [Dickeya dianthicola]
MCDSPAASGAAMFTTGTPLPAASSVVLPDATVTPAASAGNTGCSPVSHTSAHTTTRCDVFTAFIPELLNNNVQGKSVT